VVVSPYWLSPVLFSGYTILSHITIHRLDSQGVLLVRRFADPITALLAVVLLATNFINYYLGKPVYFYQLIEKLPEP